nr:PREDICTED: actin cytoskeleton-regulatory complex protein PAN1 [Anolis carolinensis]|eukprot:XP_016850177.1 PREDICTED: actin cytoskeleton-regulatory complex protein PAN1 [Anolis carolinensis]
MLTGLVPISEIKKCFLKGLHELKSLETPALGSTQYFSAGKPRGWCCPLVAIRRKAQGDPAASLLVAGHRGIKGSEEKNPRRDLEEQTKSSTRQARSPFEARQPQKVPEKQPSHQMSRNPSLRPPPPPPPPSREVKEERCPCNTDHVLKHSGKLLKRYKDIEYVQQR